MATLAFDGVDDRININPLSTSLNNIPNGACTIAGLLRRNSSATDDDVFGLRGGNMSGNYYHGLRCKQPSTSDYFDDTGLAAVGFNGSAAHPVGAGGNNFFILVFDWGTGDATERLHVSGAIGSAESWGHDNSDDINGGLQTGPGTGTGYFHIGNYDGGPWLGDFALVAIWAGTRFSDADAEALWINKATTDWWNHSAGQPDTLIELNTATPTDIGSDPASSITLSGPTLTGADPTGWTFDGRGPPVIRHDYSLFPKAILRPPVPVRY